MAMCGGPEGFKSALARGALKKAVNAAGCELFFFPEVFFCNLTSELPSGLVHRSFTSHPLSPKLPEIINSTPDKDQCDNFKQTDNYWGAAEGHQR